jgi:asparagine synthase (glutamine-hydrolysing)
MCGVVGIFAYDSRTAPISRTELITIRDSMARRGPDGAGEWVAECGRAGLGHRRLAIIDLSDAGAQPMASATEETRITFNGEIYNYRELRRGLEQQGHEFRSNSDTEVLLHLYERDGAAMVSRLRGMFTFVIWDAKRRGVFMARDPMGIKPLYYADDGRTIRIASQVKALMAGGQIDASLDPAGCVGFFLFGYIPEPFTLRQGIRALPAGHSLWIDEAGPEKPQRFFSIRDVFETAEHEYRRRSDAERHALIGEVLKDSIAAHMVSDVPVGVFLSAGLDSTSIAGLASKYSGAGLRTLTLGFLEYRGTPLDEVPVAEQVAQAFGTNHTTVWVERRDFLEKSELLLDVMDQPTTDGVNSYFVSQAAAGAGLKVALSGVGGDELFGGYPSYSQVPKIARLFSSFHHVPAFGRAVRSLASQFIGSRISPKYAGLIEYGTSLEDAYLLRRALYMPWELTEVLDPDIVRVGWEKLKPTLSLGGEISGLTGNRTRVAALEMSWYMRNQLLNDTDWAGMAHSLEVRTPFIDVEVLRRLAPLLAGPTAPTKHDMMMTTPAAALDLLLTRPKTGFLVPVSEWLVDPLADRTTERGLRGWAKLVFDHHVVQ